MEWFPDLQVSCKNCTIYINDLSIQRFWYLWGVLEPIPQDTKGQLYIQDLCVYFYESSRYVYEAKCVC